MRSTALLAGTGALLLLSAAAAAEDAPPAPARTPPSVLAHEVTVALDPATGGIEAVDRMTVLRSGGGDLVFDLRGDLALRLLEVDGRVQASVAREPADPRPGIGRYRVEVPRRPGDTGVVAVTYGGVLREAVEKAKDLAFVVGDFSRGTVSPEGAFLSEATGWVPNDGSMATWATAATVPEGWSVATQGGVPSARTEGGKTTFSFPAGIPYDGLWLQAGRWKVERRTTAGGVSIATYLSEGNAGMSGLLLDSVEEYLGLYGKVLGPYPHAKFDVVENFFSTGYGMPTATLLGGDVVQHMGVMAQRAGGRIPPGYIDHELVHCWWGNGVFVDYERGNWCEALTSYCSNYLRKEWESPEEAAKHRRGTRARFAARVRPEKDYALRKFTGKTEDFENDIGYGKGSMAFHMVRRAVGDEAFWGGIRDFARQFVGKRASWEEIRGCLEKRSGRNLETLFSQMLDRTGAPVLVLADCAAAPAAGGWTVSGKVVQATIAQGRAIPLWSLAAPLVVETARGREAITLDVATEETAFTIRAADLPLRVLLDPESECWRGYRWGGRHYEVPPTLDTTLHDRRGVEVWMPAGEEGKPYEVIAEGAVQQRGARLVRFDAEGKPDAEPSYAQGGLLRLGLRQAKHLAEDPSCPFRFSERGVSVGGQTFAGDDVAVLASVRATGDTPVTCYFGMSPAALSAARRVFFYGGDGVVVFKAGRPVLRLEPEGDESSRAALLDSLMPEASAERARALVDDLCAKPLEGRLAGTDAGDAALARIEKALADDGLAVVRQEFSFEVADWDGAACLAAGGEEAVQRGLPFCFSPPVTEWKSPAPLLVDAGTKVESFLADLHAALESGAAAVLVLGPPEPPAALADYLLHPSALPAKETERLRGAPADLAVEGRRSRLLMPGFEVNVPVVYYGKEPEESWLPTQVRSPVSRRTVRTANLLAVIPGADPALADEAVLLGAHHDHLGPGLPGANDDASGVAAVREAGRALLAAKGALRRPVVLAIFGAEEWGLRGSRHFVEHRPAGVPRIAAALTLDTVGQAGVPEVNVVGESVYPAGGALVARCLGGAGLGKGRDIDKFAFAWGSDHYSFHRAGVPGLDLFSAEYRTMHTAADSPATVDEGKVARIARAAAAWAISVSRDGAPR